jgi:hypothetical protein
MTAITVWMLRIVERLYRAALLIYPRTFRRAYGDAMAQAFRDRCRAASRRAGVAGLLGVCGAELRDLVVTAAREHGDEIRTLARRFQGNTAMVAETHTQAVPLRLWVTIAATALAFVVSLLASLNLYLLEDANPLTPAAYSASPLLRFSYDGVYLSALVAAVSVCTIVGYAVMRDDAPVLLGLAIVALVVAFGGFGGLLIRHPATFLILFLVFVGLVLCGLLVGRAVAARMRPRLGRRPAAVLGACVSTSVALLVNLVVLVPHTIALNPVSHTLYMQGRIGETHLNSLLIGMGIELLTVIVCAVSIGSALRAATR